MHERRRVESFGPPQYDAMDFTVYTERSKNLMAHLPLALVFRITAAGLSYLIVALTIRYLDVERYGIWVTLLSVLTWATFFDVGLGNSLRNQLTAALAKDERQQARILVSTGYGGISMIALAFFLLILGLVPIVPWQAVFNTAGVSERELSLLVTVVAFLFLFHFVLTLGNPIFYAFQKPSLPALGLTVQNFLAIASIAVLMLLVPGNLVYLGICYGASMVLSLGILTVFFFKKHPEVAPAYSFFRIERLKSIATLGFRFFVIQMSALVIFTTDNLIITQVLGPEEVTPYNVLFRLFSIVTLVHGILVTALWSAFTDAYVKEDVNWIRTTIRRMNILMIPIVGSVALLMAFARDIIAIWVGQSLAFSDLLLVLMGISVIVITWNNIYGHFINGVGEIGLQSRLAMVAGVLNIPLSIYFAKGLAMGSAGVILGTILCLGIFSVAIPWQSYRIIRRMGERRIAGHGLPDM